MRACLCAWSFGAFTLPRGGSFHCYWTAMNSDMSAGSACCRGCVPHLVDNQGAVGGERDQRKHAHGNLQAACQRYVLQIHWILQTSFIQHPSFVLLTIGAWTADASCTCLVRQLLIPRHLLRHVLPVLSST